MPVPVCIQNNILVELPHLFNEEVVSGKFKFYQDTTFRPEWNTVIKGTVISVPKKITIGSGAGQSLDPDRVNINPIVKEGDELIFNYLVVMKRKQTDNVGDVFERDDPKLPNVNTWTNPKGLKVIRAYLMNNKYEIGLYDTKSKTWIDKIFGNFADTESFMGKYMPTENVEFNYGNYLPFGSNDYWMVDYANAIAIRHGVGDYEMVGDYVIVEPIREPFKRHQQGLIEVYNMKQDDDYRAVGKVISIGEPLKGQVPLNIKKNDTIVADIRYVEKYEIDGHDYWVVRQKYIYGKQPVTHDTIRNS